MSTHQNASDLPYDQPVVTADDLTDADYGGAAASYRSVAGDAPTQAAVRTENLLLRARVEALERALADSRAEQREVIDRYEALLSERRSRSAESGRTASDFGRASRTAAVLARVRAWTARRR